MYIHFPSYVRQKLLHKGHSCPVKVFYKLPTFENSEAFSKHKPFLHWFFFL